MNKLKRLFGGSLCFTEKVLYFFLAVALLKIFGQKLHLGNFLLFVGIGSFIFAVIFYFTIRKLNKDLSPLKLKIISVFVFCAFLACVPLSLYSEQNNQKTTSTPAIYVGYLDSNRFYTDDIDSLLLLGLILQLSNDDEKAEKFVSLFLSGKIHYVANPLKSTFYNTVVDSAVSFTVENSAGDFVRAFTFRFWTRQQQ